MDLLSQQHCKSAHIADQNAYRFAESAHIAADRFAESAHIADQNADDLLIQNAVCRSLWFCISTFIFDTNTAP